MRVCVCFFGSSYLLPTKLRIPGFSRPLTPVRYCGWNVLTGLLIYLVIIFYEPCCGRASFVILLCLFVFSTDNNDLWEGRYRPSSKGVSFSNVVTHAPSF